MRLSSGIADLSLVPAVMEEVKRAFDAAASRYDAQRKFIIPDFEGFYRAAIWALDGERQTPAILDIGAGTGLLSDMILHRYPLSIITLMDISENMLSVARQRFRDRENVRYVIADYRHEGVEGTYDLICSALSIHHLAEGEKYRLYRRVFDCLKRGGVFVNADQVEGESAWMHQRNMDYWDSFILGSGLPRDEAEEVLFRRNTYDHMEKLSVQLRWLQEIGFYDVEVVYKNRPFAVFLGRKEE